MVGSLPLRLVADCVTVTVGGLLELLTRLVVCAARSVVVSRPPRLVVCSVALVVGGMHELLRRLVVG